LRDQLPRFVIVLAFAFVALGSAQAGASPRDPWRIDWLDPSNSESGLRASSASAVLFPPIEASDRAVALSLSEPSLESAGQAAQPRPHAVEYSHGYEVRRKIHVYVSFAMIPLFVTQGVLGAKLYNNPTDNVRSAHKAVAWSIASLFGVNTVTGLWNLKEGWKNPVHRKLRLTHGLLMLGADAGFVATGLLAPNREGTSGNRSAHRAVALTSIATATTGYLVMLFGR